MSEHQDKERDNDEYKRAYEDGRRDAYAEISNTLMWCGGKIAEQSAELGSVKRELKALQMIQYFAETERDWSKPTN